jgi:hypothetical protein
MRLIDHRRQDYIPPRPGPRLLSLDPPRHIWRTLGWICLACAVITGAIWWRLS